MTQTKAELLQTRHQGDIRLGDADSTHYVGFKAPSTVSSSLVWTLPAADGTANYLLKTDGSGNLGWVADSSTDSTKMPLAGGTFTGDVIFDGATAGRDITYDRSADNLIFNDNAKAVFGNSSDGLEIYHGGSNSVIADTGTGNLILRSNGNGIYLQSDETENLATFVKDGNCFFYSNNTKRFETQSTGTKTTGTRHWISNPGDTVRLDVGSGATDDQYAYIDLVGDTTYSNFGLRLIRNDSGANTNSALIHRGTGSLILQTSDAGSLLLKTSATTALTLDTSQNATFAANIVANSGKVLVGDTTSRTGAKLEASDTGATGSLSLRRYTANAHPSYIEFFKSRSATLGGETVVQSGDNLGQITWGGSDGTDRAYAAFIDALVDGTPGDDDMPGRLVFSTSADGSASPTERLRISSTGVSKFTGGISQVATAAGALDLDLRTSNYFTKTISGNSTFTFSNPAASGTVSAFTLELTHSSGTVTWPTSVKWNGDSAPTLTAGKTHLFMFVTDDGGSRYRGAALVDYVN